MPRKPQPLTAKNDPWETDWLSYHDRVLDWFNTVIAPDVESIEATSIIRVAADRIDPDGWRCITLDWLDEGNDRQMCDCWFGPGFSWWSSDIPF